MPKSKDLGLYPKYPGATQKSWRIYFQFVVPPLGGLSRNQ